ncbi:MAG: DUF1573 domain-containing protein [Odoribacter sp.]
MKFFLYLITALLLSAYSFAQGVLECKKSTIVMKELKADDQSTTVTYTVKNTGEQPVIITRVLPMSSSLKPGWTREPLMPGKTGEIKLSFISSNLQENFNFQTLVYSNARNNRLELNLSGQIVDNPAKPELLYKYNLEGIKFKNTNISFDKVYTWQTVSEKLTFINTRKDSVALTVQYQPSYIQTTFVPTKVAPGQKGTLLVTFNAPQKNDYGYCYESLILSLNNARNYNNRLTITANLTEDFSKLDQKQLANAPIAEFDKKEVSFGDIKTGEKANCDFTLTNKGKSDLIVRKTKASCGCTAVTLGQNTLAPGKSTVIRTIFDSTGKNGRQYKTITVITNDPKNTETTLTINGNIK